MIANKCLVCGSSNFRADRALSGRLVCNSCGTPFGVGRQLRNKPTIYNNFSLNKKYILFIFIFTLAFFLVII